MGHVPMGVHPLPHDNKPSCDTHRAPLRQSHPWVTPIGHPRESLCHPDSSWGPYAILGGPSGLPLGTPIYPGGSSAILGVPPAILRPCQRGSPATLGGLCHPTCPQPPWGYPEPPPGSPLSPRSPSILVFPPAIPGGPSATLPVPSHLGVPQ